MSGRHRAIFVVCLLLLLTAGLAPAAASTIFTFNQPRGSSAGFLFATTVSNFTAPYLLAGGGNQNAVLGSPDAIFSSPNTPQYVDFGGGAPDVAWAVTVGFGAAFADGPGVDIRIFTTQLDSTEGFDLSASADGTTFSALGTSSHSPPRTPVSPRLTWI